MIIKYERNFKKQYKKLPEKQKEQFNKCLALFIKNPDAPSLRIHPLKGAYANYWSMNISGDLRAIYKKVGDEIIIFAIIGTHSQLYG